MRYFQLQRDDENELAVLADGEAYDLTSVKPALDSFESLIRTAEITDRQPEDVVESLLDRAEPVSQQDLEKHRVQPLSVDEVWAAGVTYQISEEARTEESTMPEMYIDVYDAERPELFFKATDSRTVGPEEGIGIRGDSEWDVPEPELGIVLYQGEVVGYTVGNDVSSRSLEGQNPLYLPQAKVYDRCCAIGPCIATDIADPHDLELSMRISRDGEVLYEDATSTGEMVRTCEELVSYYKRHNVVPDLAVLLTGTPLVPEDSFTLHPGDQVDIDIEGIGTLSNPVTEV